MSTNREELLRLFEAKRYEDLLSVSYAATVMEIVNAHLRLSATYRDDAAVLSALNEAKAELTQQDAFTIGKRLFEMGRLAEALPSFEKAVGDDPRPERSLWYGATLVSLRRYRKAITVLLRSTKRSKGTDPSTLFWLSRALLDSGRARDSLPHLQQLVKVRGNNDDRALLQKAQAAVDEGLHEFESGQELVKAGKLSDALEHLKEAARLRGEAADHFLLGDTLAKVDKHKEAIRPLRKALKLHPSIAHHRALGMSLTALQRHDEAMKHLSRAVEKGGDASDHFRLGKALAMRGDHEEACQQLLAAVQKSQDELQKGQFRMELGRVLLTLGPFEDALPHLEEGVRCSGLPEDYSALGTVFADRGHHSQALPFLREALKRRGAKQDHCALGKSLAALGQWDEAMPRLEYSLDMDSDGSGHFLMGRAYFEQGHPDKSLGCFENAVTLRGSDLDHVWLGIALVRLGRRDEALPHLQRCDGLGDDPQTSLMLGCAFVLVSQQEAAIPHFRKAVSTRGNAQDHYWLGKTLLERERTQSGPGAPSPGVPSSGKDVERDKAASPDVLFSEIESRVSALEAEVRAKKEELETAKRQSRGLQEENERLNHSLTASGSIASRTRQEKDRLISEISELRARIGERDKSLAEGKNTARAAQEHNDQLRARITSLEKEVAALKTTHEQWVKYAQEMKSASDKDGNRPSQQTRQEVKVETGASRHAREVVTFFATFFIVAAVLVAMFLLLGFVIRAVR